MQRGRGRAGRGFLSLSPQLRKLFRCPGDNGGFRMDPAGKRMRKGKAAPSLCGHGAGGMQRCLPSPGIQLFPSLGGSAGQVLASHHLQLFAPRTPPGPGGNSCSHLGDTPKIESVVPKKAEGVLGFSWGFFGIPRYPEQRERSQIRALASSRGRPQTERQ